MNILQIGAFAGAAYLAYNYVAKRKLNAQSEKSLMDQKEDVSIIDEDNIESFDEKEVPVEAIKNGEPKNKNNWDSDVLSKGL